MEYVKWAVAIASLALLGRMSLVRRAGSVLRAIAVRFGLLAVGTVALSGTFSAYELVTYERPASAETCLQKVIPGDALDGAIFSQGASGALVAGSASTIAAGGATLTMATGGTALVAAAAFLGTVSATCSFLDWVSGDGDAVVLPPTLSTSSITVGAIGSCVYSGGTYGAATDNRCVPVTFPAAPTGVRVYTTNEGTRNWHNGALTMPEASQGPNPALFPRVTGLFGGAHWRDPSLPSNSCYTYVGGGDQVSGGCTTVGAQTSIELIFPSCGSNGNIGGNCGRLPGAIYYVTTSNATTGLVNAVWHPNPTARDKGWSRVIIADVKCQTQGTSTFTWVRGTSAVYYDREVSARVSMPSCPVGTVAAETLIRRIPTGVSCTLGVIGSSGYCTQGTVLAHSITPNSLLTGTGPAWRECLKVGTDCGTPSGDTSTCVWGGHAVPGSFCDPETHSGDPETNPETVPQTVGTVEPEPYTPGEPATTTDQPPPTSGGGGTGTGAAIDPGEGQRPPGEYSEPVGECWPDGFGWFNPAEWVLRPIKCALEWAFVPDPEQVQNAWDGLMAEAETNVPVAWVYAAYTVISDASAGTEAAIAATRDDCIQVIPDGGELVATSHDGNLCVASMAGTGTWLSDARPWLGVAVWIFWALSMYNLLFRKPVQSSEPQQLTLF